MSVRSRSAIMRPSYPRLLYLSKSVIAKGGSPRHNQTRLTDRITSLTTSVAQTRLAGWLNALERLRPASAPHRDERVSREQALLLLRCGKDVLNELCDRGLPHSGTPPEEHYDSSDLMNLALMSGSNHSLPELGASFVWRTAKGAPSDWACLHRWMLQTSAFAEHGPECGENPSWSFRRPTPESFGGRCLEWGEGSIFPLAETAAFSDSDPSSTLSLSGRIVTRGEVRVVRSRYLRELYREVLETMEFVVLPASIETDVDAIASAGGADCVGISSLLERECRRAGYHAAARRGYLLGLLGMSEHCWLEVIDDDGKMKVLDPTLPIVARASPTPTPAFTAFCLGSISNRLLPFDCPIGDQLVAHRCGGERVASHSLTVVAPDDDGDAWSDGSTRVP